MTVLYINVDDRAAWLAARRTGIGGSDVAAICGVDPWRGAVAVWAEKVGDSLAADNDTATERMRWGNRLESAIADEFADQTGYEVLAAAGLYRDREHEFMIATPDRIVATDDDRLAVLEIKTTDARFAGDWDEQPPERVQLQTQHYLRVVGADVGFIAVLIGGNTYRQFELARDDALIEDLIVVETDFWRHVTERRMPAIDGHQSTSKALDQLYNHVRAGQVELAPDTAMWLDRYHQAKAAAKVADADADEAAAHVKSALGEFDTGTIDGRIAVTWKTTSRRVCDFDELAARFPDAYAATVSMSESRRFLPKKLKP